MRIFEPRYLDMISQQMRKGEGFVIAQAVAGDDFLPLAVLVNIVDWDKLPDGLLGITVEGQKVVRIDAHRVENNGLILGLCEPAAVADTEVQDIDIAAWDGLLDVLNQFKAYPGIAELNLPAVETAVSLGWQLLQLLPISALERQKALCLSTQGRLQWIAATLDRLSHG